MEECPLLHIELIPLTRGKYAIVDKADYATLSQHNWFAVPHKNTFYAKRNIRIYGRKTMRYMHREILNGEMIDHINRNGLDNRKFNLRACSNRQNQQNRKPRQGSTSRYKGVNLDTVNNKWKARICLNGKQIHLGRFDSEIAAARAYDLMAKELFGQFARLNFVESKTVGGTTVLGNNYHGTDAKISSKSQIREADPVRGFSIPQAVASV
jgi:hypothetical protein